MPLFDLARRVVSVRGSSHSTTYSNREGRSDFDFSIGDNSLEPGVSAMIRAKDESAKILDSIASVLGVFDEIVFVDNGSEDETLELVQRLKADRDADDRIRILEYPHKIARCGSEHRSTPADSVHSLVYYYNWCLSRCSRSWVFKWDADMVLDQDHVREMAFFLLNRVEGTSRRMWKVPVRTVFRAADGGCYSGVREVYSEVRLFPNIPQVRFFKGRHFELLKGPGKRHAGMLEDVEIFEIKDLGEEEFAHWSDRSFPTKRKKLEWARYNQLRRGDVKPADWEVFAGSRLRVGSAKCRREAGGDRDRQAPNRSRRNSHRE